MDCAICYAAITQATGKLELACSHSFHINCLASWFETLNKTQRTQECPYCRHGCSELETIPISREMREMTILHEREIRYYRASLRIANENADLAWEDAREAEEIARNLNTELHEYRLEQHARDVLEKKQQSKEKWAKWTTNIKK